MDRVEQRIQACIDGELGPAEAEAVRAHCAACSRCGRVWVEVESVGRALDEAPPVANAAPLWPLVAARLRGERRLRLRPAFALGAGLAVVAGLTIGLRLGQSPVRIPSGGDDDVAFLAAGSLLDDEAATTLDELYFTVPAEDR